MVIGIGMFWALFECNNLQVKGKQIVNCYSLAII